MCENIVNVGDVACDLAMGKLKEKHEKDVSPTDLAMSQISQRDYVPIENLHYSVGCLDKVELIEWPTVERVRSQVQWLLRDDPCGRHCGHVGCPIGLGSRPISWYSWIGYRRGLWLARTTKRFPEHLWCSILMLTTFR